MRCLVAPGSMYTSPSVMIIVLCFARVRSLFIALGLPVFFGSVTRWMRLSCFAKRLIILLVLSVLPEEMISISSIGSFCHSSMTFFIVFSSLWTAMATVIGVMGVFRISNVLYFAFVRVVAFQPSERLGNSLQKGWRSVRP